MLIADYINGNARIKLWSDGTREITTEDDEFKFEMPTNIDMQITTKCDNRCPWCYADCTENGVHAELLNNPVLDGLNPGQELAINLNDMTHHQLVRFLQAMKTKKVFVNGTINQVHFMKYSKILESLCNQQLLWGLGVSLQKPTKEFVEEIKKFPNAVIHVIAGIVTGSDLEILRDNGLKLLILGYKNVGRGNQYLSNNDLQIEINRKYLKDHLPVVRNSFKVISFDNLALKQLDVRKTLQLSDEDWERFYQGDEGSQTMYVDLVANKFGISSLIPPQQMHPIGNLSIKEMFEIIKHKSKTYSL